ncbi:hypothetical protein [Variovorax sp. DT-64]|uniref:hypothetical protein n=1 Tax=Variovorax sp. DT-64 TaxID=3396160 RepID=UPI003F194434
MMRFLKTPLAFSVLMAAMAGPALAGNYAEGDPRPATLTSSASRTDIAADAQGWLQSAPTQGYPEGDPQAMTRVSGNTRAVIQADTLTWMRSGLAAVQNGEAGADTSRPAYWQAAAEYARLRKEPGFGGLIAKPG